VDNNKLFLAVLAVLVFIGVGIVASWGWFILAHHVTIVEFVGISFVCSGIIFGVSFIWQLRKELKK
jgi:hypothetical protein